jgi:hypothetical protein
MPKGSGKGGWRGRRGEKRGWEGREEGEVREERGSDSQAKRKDRVRREKERGGDGIVGPEGSPNEFGNGSGGCRRKEDQTKEVGKTGKEESIDDPNMSGERDMESPDLEGSGTG